MSNKYDQLVARLESAGDIEAAAMVNELRRMVEHEFKCRIVEVARLKSNHKDVVETKRRTDERLRAALAALQQVYTISGDGFEAATHERTRADGGE